MPLIGLVEESFCRSLHCSVSSRIDDHGTKGAIELTLKQKCLDHLILNWPAGRTHICSPSGKEKSRSVKQLVIGHAFPLPPLPDPLLHDPPASATSGPGPHCQMLTEAVSQIARRLLSKLSPPDQKRRSYGK